MSIKTSFWNSVQQSKVFQASKSFMEIEWKMHYINAASSWICQVKSCYDILVHEKKEYNLKDYNL